MHGKGRKPLAEQKRSLYDVGHLNMPDVIKAETHSCCRLKIVFLCVFLLCLGAIIFVQYESALGTDPTQPNSKP